MQKRQSVWSGIFLAAGLAASAHASVITVTDDSSGWFTSGSSNNYFNSGTENYFVGYCSGDGCGSEGEHRNFFSFSIPELDGPITSAVMTVNTGGTSFAQNPIATYQLSSLPDTFGFDDIGSGTLFGSLDYSVDSTDTDESIVLNNAGIAAIAPNSTFSVAGLITNLSSNAGSDQYLFGADGAGDGTAQLTITTQDNSEMADPEPQALGLCSLGLATLACAYFRRKN